MHHEFIKAADDAEAARSSAVRQRLDEMTAALEPEKAAQGEREKALEQVQLAVDERPRALRRGQRALEEWRDFSSASSSARSDGTNRTPQGTIPQRSEATFG
jgi:hypothetical protein